MYLQCPQKYLTDTAYTVLDIGPGQGTPCTSWQLITVLTFRDKGPHTLTLAPMDNLESPISLTPDVCLWSVRGSRSTERDPMQTRHIRPFVDFCFTCVRSVIY